MTEAEDIATAERFPAEWERANSKLTGRSKARQKLRQRYRNAVAFDAFRAAHPTAACSNCAHSCRDPGVGFKGLTCDLDSDFRGYQMVDERNVCTRWSA